MLKQKFQLCCVLLAPGPRLCDCSSRSLLSNSWAFFSSSSCFLRSSAVVAFTTGLNTENRGQTGGQLSQKRGSVYSLNNWKMIWKCVIYSVASDKKSCYSWVEGVTRAQDNNLQKITKVFLPFEITHILNKNQKSITQICMQQRCFLLGLSCNQFYINSGPANEKHPCSLTLPLPCFSTRMLCS